MEAHRVAHLGQQLVVQAWVAQRLAAPGHQLRAGDREGGAGDGRAPVECSVGVLGTQAPTSSSCARGTVLSAGSLSEVCSPAALPTCASCLRHFMQSVPAGGAAASGGTASLPPPHPCWLHCSEQLLAGCCAVCGASAGARAAPVLVAQPACSIVTGCGSGGCSGPCVLGNACRIRGGPECLQRLCVLSSCTVRPGRTETAASAPPPLPPCLPGTPEAGKRPA